MRIAILGPFTGQSLADQFDLAPDIDVLPPGYPGAPLMAVLAKALVERGHHVAAVTTDYFTPIKQLEPYRAYHSKSVSAYFCPQRPHSFRWSDGRLGRALDFFKYERECLVTAINDFAPDVIHAHWTYEFVWAALDSAFPTLATAHDSPAKVLRFTPNLYRATRYVMARRVLHQCKHLTAVSPDLAAGIQNLVRTPITVVANPIADSVLSAAGCNEAAFSSKSLLMVLNGWDRLKNGAVALQAFSLSRRSDPSLHLACLGAGYEADGPAHRWAKQNTLDGGVAFLGSVPHSVILEKMQSSTALLHPSRVEACSMVIAEAMSLGLPVIAGRNTGGVPWQLDNGRAGVLADITNVRDITTAILSIARDQDSWNKKSVFARERARQLFAIDRVVDQYEALYKKTRSSELEPRLSTATT